jgi:hypothetical protein
MGDDPSQKPNSFSAIMILPKSWTDTTLGFFGFLFDSIVEITVRVMISEVHSRKWKCRV